MVVTVGTLQKWYATKQHDTERDSLPNIKNDDALHMLAKFLIQGIRAWGIFRNGKDVGALYGKQDKYNLSDIRKAYEIFKTCVYNPMCGPITHDSDKTFDIVPRVFYPSMKPMLKHMIDQMVNLYTKKTEITYYPRNWYGACPKNATGEPTHVTIGPNEQEELSWRINNGTTEKKLWMNEWCQVFTGIFGEKPYFARSDITSINDPNLEVGKILAQSGGKSTRRARTKRARRAKRHTRRAARREYRAR